MTPDTCYIVWDEHSLKISALELFQFGFDSVLKMFGLKGHLIINELINHEPVYRTAPATLGMLIIQGLLNIAILSTLKKNYR